MAAALAVNGTRVDLEGVPPSTRLVEFLRTRTRFRGPKLACGEGGCGACAVICERFDPLSGTTSRCTLNACLATVGSMVGCSLTTSEGLGNSKSVFHPVQDALARNFASQCGFCSPGITVALAAAAAEAAAAADTTDQHAHPASSSGGGECDDSAAAVALAQGLDGNLCRCTGLRPLIDTCRSIADMEDLCTTSSSSSSRSCAPACHAGSCVAATATSSSSSHSLPPLPAFPDWLKQHCHQQRQQQQQQQQQQQWAIASNAAAVGASNTWAPFNSSSRPGGQVWLSPCTLQQLAGMLRQHGASAQLVAGNTGAGVYKDLWPHAAPVVITTHSVAEMTAVSHQAHGVILGGAVTIQQLLQLLRAPAAAAAAAAACKGQQRQGAAPASTAKAWGALADHVERIAGVHVRSAATLGGHFGLCDIRPLPSDLALLLAAAGAQLQVLMMPQQQQQQQQGAVEALDLKWMSAEAFLADSAVGCAAAGSGSGTAAASVAAGTGGTVAADFVLEPDAIAGAHTLLLTEQQDTCTHAAQPPSHQQQQQERGTGAAHSTGSSSSSSVRRVVTAVWLPYADDGSERFWSYKLSWRHANSHAFVNMALWVKLDSGSGSSDSSSSSGSSGGCDGSYGSSSSSSAPADAAFAGRRVSAAMLFVGCPPCAPDPAAAAAAGGSCADEEAWVVVRLARVEEVLTCGSPVTVQVLIAALRQLEQQLQQQAGLAPSSFHAQALQGALFKALVPLMHQHPRGAVSPQLLRLLQLPDVYDPRRLPRGRQVLPGPTQAQQQQQEADDTAHSTAQAVAQRSQQPCLISCHPRPAAAAAAAAQQAAIGSTAAAAVGQAGCPGGAPLNTSVEKDAVRLQASGEAEYTADVAAKMGPRVLYLAGVRSTRALAALVSVDASAALALPAVVACLTAKDVPGSNSVFDQPLLAAWSAG